MQIIRHDAETGARIVDDPWDPAAILSLEQLEGADADGLAVKVDGSTDPGVLAPYLPRLGLIVIELPKFTDGRAYSLARLLRARHGYEGELRVVGDVLRDQLFFLWRCGFDSFVLADGKDLEGSLNAWDDFSVTYQPGDDHQKPIWRRRG